MQDGDLHDVERYRPLIWWWWTGNGKPLDQIEFMAAERATERFPELLASSEGYSSLGEAGYEALGSLESDLHGAVLKALLRRALEGDAAAVDWLEERGLLPELDLVRRRPRGAVDS